MAGDQQTYREVLTLFNIFHTGTIDNFTDMLIPLKFPFEHNKNKTLAKNRCDFKDFFSCLTNIRCVVVEESHCCDTACWTLQGYKLGYPIPLAHHNFDIPPASTLFKSIPAHVYDHKNEGIQLNTPVLKYFKDISKKIAN